MIPMRLAILLLLITLPAPAEFRRVEVTFESTGCVPCAESLPARLERVRGVEKVELDLAASRVAIRLEPENGVRLAPLLARITQDGTKITRVEVVARGTIEHDGERMRFHPSGIAETFRFKLSKSAPKAQPQPDSAREVRGGVSEIEAGAEALFTAESVEALPAATR